MRETKEISKTFSNVELILNEKEMWKSGAIISLQYSKRIQSFLKKVKKLYKNKFEKSMTAISFAEAGEFSIAKDILNNDKKDEKNGDNPKY